MTQAATLDRARYEVERTLGRGGMATVYLAHDNVLDRRVALKVLAEHLAGDEAFRTRFLREARLAARIAHPNVVQIYDTGEHESSLFIAMECVDGESLAEELASRGPLTAAEVVDVGLQLCSALDAAHAAGLVHRDVKPQNILRARGGTVKLGDFGIARSHDTTALTEHGAVLGTAAYLSPEQARGEEVTGSADLYALGVVLYETLTGRRPHDGGNLAELVVRREREAVLPPSVLVAGVPHALDRAILGCLALHPEQRPASAAALACALAAAMPEAATRPLPAPADTRATDVMTAATVVAPAPAGRQHGRLAGALVVLGALAAGIVFAVLASTGSGDAKKDAAATTRAKAAVVTPPLPPPAAPVQQAFQPVVQKPKPHGKAKPAKAKPHGKAKPAKHKPKHAKHGKPKKK